MAKLILEGRMARVELLPYPDDQELTMARCINHGHFAWSEPCTWWETYDTTDDAVQYAADHADTGR